MGKLHISDSLYLPLDAQTETIVVYGAKGKGKTNFGIVLAEELYKNDLKFSALDPFGLMWGLRHGATKTSKGIEVLILGGVHGDIAILPTAGAVVADLVSDEDISTIVDISRHPSGKMWSKGEKIRFVADYATRLFERQGEHQRPLMQIMDEAGRFCPQSWPHGAPEIARCVGAIEELVEVGRNVGIGVTLITQRSARMNKSVSELAECMVAFCTLGPNSIDAILDWCGEHIEKARWKELVAELRKLPRGDAMVVSPSWLNFEGVVHVRQRETFDSSATPKAGKRRLAPGKASKPDLAKYQARMAAVAEQAKADNPAELRRRIAELERELKTKPAETKTERVEVPLFDKQAFEELKHEVGEHITLALSNTKGALHVYMSKAMGKAGATSGLAGAPIVRHAQQTAARLAVGSGQPKPGRVSLHPAPGFPATTANGEVKLGRCERALLVAFAQRHPARSSANQVAILSGYSLTSSGFQNALSTLRKAGLVDGYGSMGITSDGLASAGEVPTMPTGMERVTFWQNKLGRCEAAILGVLAKAYPDPIARSALAHMAGYSETSSGFQNALSTLRTLEFIQGKAGEPLQARRELFE